MALQRNYLANNGGPLWRVVHKRFGGRHTSSRHVAKQARHDILLLQLYVLTYLFILHTPYTQDGEQDDSEQQERCFFAWFS